MLICKNSKLKKRVMLKLKIKNGFFKFILHRNQLSSQIGKQSSANPGWGKFVEKLHKV